MRGVLGCKSYLNVGFYNYSVLNLSEGLGRGERAGAVAELDHLDVVADMDLSAL